MWSSPRVLTGLTDEPVPCVKFAGSHRPIAYGLEIVSNCLERRVPELPGAGQRQGLHIDMAPFASRLRSHL
jgi:hypothetical protein